MLRLVSWNVNARVRDRQRCQAEALDELRADVVALQEVTPANAPAWRQSLAGTGFLGRGDELRRAQPDVAFVGSRRAGVLIASRWPLSLLDPIDGLPWPERALGVVIDSSFGLLELHTVYVPLGEREGDLKALTLEALHRALARPSDRRPECATYGVRRRAHPDVGSERAVRVPAEVARAAWRRGGA